MKKVLGENQANERKDWGTRNERVKELHAKVSQSAAKQTEYMDGTVRRKVFQNTKHQQENEIRRAQMQAAYDQLLQEMREAEKEPFEIQQSPRFQRFYAKTQERMERVNRMMNGSDPFNAKLFKEIMDKEKKAEVIAQVKSAEKMENF